MMASRRTPAVQAETMDVTDDIAAFLTERFPVLAARGVTPADAADRQRPPSTPWASSTRRLLGERFASS